LAVWAEPAWALPANPKGVHCRGYGPRDTAAAHTPG